MSETYTTSVVKYIRTYHPTLIIPKLGEHKRTKSLRTYAYHKGYSAWQYARYSSPFDKSKYSGFAIELKTPTLRGVVSENQSKVLRQLRANTLIYPLTYARLYTLSKPSWHMWGISVVDAIEGSNQRQHCIVTNVDTRSPVTTQ